MTLDIAKELISEHRWIFAKTMPENPHEYTLRNTWKDDQDFVDLVKLIREEGIKEKYKKSYYTVLYINDHKYWTMGAPLDVTILINRAKV